MKTDYTEQDTERTRTQERTSAGMQTVQLGEYATPPAVSPPAPVRATPSRNALALVLIALGALMLLGQIWPDPGAMTAALILLTIASVFLFFSFAQRIYGLMIPGALMGGLSLGIAFASITNGVSVLWGLALGFAAIYLLGSSMFGMRHPWPLIPGVILFGVGTIVLITSLPAFLAGGAIWIPLLLIGLGLLLGWGRRPRP